MTTLGYQVQNCVECSELLEQWLQQANGKAVDVWGKTPVGSGCAYGINPEDFPWGIDNVYMFKETENGCEFTTQNEQFVLTLCELPCDTWGNTATYSQGITLTEGFIEVAYEDTNYVEYQFPLEWEIEDGYHFLEWIETNHSELISEIEEETVCNGTANSWRYVTSNKEFNHPDWVQAWNTYKLEQDQD